MTQEQLKHYLKGGKFRGVYNPTVTDDLERENYFRIGETFEFYQNFDITVIVSGKYEGQHRFNSYGIYGWVPEEDIEGLTIIHGEYIEFPEPLPQYMYRMTYTKMSQIGPNFGIGYDDIDLPFVVTRAYNIERRDYVINELSNPKPTTIEECVWNGERELTWNVIYTE